MEMTSVGVVVVRPRPKRATLVFRSGEMHTVVVDVEGWPAIIDREFEGRIVRFMYAGVQHGVGAYTEEGMV